MTRRSTGLSKGFGLMRWETASEAKGATVVRNLADLDGEASKVNHKPVHDWAVRVYLYLWSRLGVFEIRFDRPPRRYDVQT